MRRKHWYLTGCIILTLLLMSSCSQKEVILSDIINSTDQFKVTAELVGEVPRIDGFRIMQGGCVTEKYAWFAMINEENASSYYKTESYIIKYDRENMKEISRSEVLMLGHANDITYIPSTNELYVIHVDKKLVSVLDADSLELKEQKKMGSEGHAIDYNESRDCFVTATGQLAMNIRDRNLKLIGYSDGENTTLTTQGICADDKYIYHVLYSSSKNVEEPENMIFVFDWDGNLITKIPIGFKAYEPENISIVGDTIYIGFNDRLTWESGKVYAMKLEKEK